MVIIVKPWWMSQVWQLSFQILQLHIADVKNPTSLLENENTTKKKLFEQAWKISFHSFLENVL